MDLPTAGCSSSCMRRCGSAVDCRRGSGSGFCRPGCPYCIPTPDSSTSGLPGTVPCPQTWLVPGSCDKILWDGAMESAGGATRGAPTRLERSPCPTGQALSVCLSLSMLALGPIKATALRTDQGLLTVSGSWLHDRHCSIWNMVSGDWPEPQDSRPSRRPSG